MTRGRVFLLHGFLGSRVQMLPMAANLMRDGWKVRNYGYESTRFSIQEHAQQLVECLKDTEHQQISFVTHSFGGVVLRAALSQPECPHNARKSRIVLIAPPLAGSELARRMKTLPSGMRMIAEAVMGQKSGAQLRDIESDGFQTSLGSFPTESNILLVVGNAGAINPLLSPQSDGVVTVDEVISGVNTVHRRLTLRATHNVLLYSPKVISSASAFLKGTDEIGELVTPNMNCIEDSS